MAPKRAFGGVLRPFGGGFRGPNRERASVFSGAGRGRAGGSAVEPGGGASVFSGAGQGGAGGSAVEPGGGASVFSGAERGRGQRVQRRGTGAVQGVLRWSRGGASAFSGGARCGTGSSEVQTGRAGRRVAKKVFRREDAPAARTQKKCSEGKVRRRPNTYGHKKNGPRSVHFYFCYTTLLLYGLLLRDARPIHPAARQRLRTPGARLFCVRLPAACSPATACLPSISVCPSVGVTAVKASAIRSLSRSAARRSGLSRLAAGISAVRVAPRESLRPPPGSQFSAAGVTVLSRPGSRPSAARNLPSLLLAPSAAGVTAPPRQYGRPPATGESPASSLRRASPARDSTAYRPAP